MQYPKFNHEGESASEMLNITEDDASRIKNLIMYEAVKGNILADELYPDEEPPKVLTTKSGCMERCFKYIYTEQEKTFMLMIFAKTHEGISKLYHLHEGLSKHMGRFKAEMLSSSDDNNDEINDQLKSLIVKKIEADMNKKLQIVNNIIAVMKETNYDYPRFNEVFTERYGDLTESIIKALESINDRVIRVEHDDEDDDD